MQTNYLKYFVDVAELGSITAAASEDFITPQGMSRSLSVFESSLGCQLFKRTKGRLFLTSYGEALLEDAKEILCIQQDMVDQVEAIRSHEIGVSNKTVLAYLNNIAFDAALFYPLTDSFEQIFANARYYQCDNACVVDNLVEHAGDEDCVTLGLLSLFSPDNDINAQLIEKLRANGFEYQPYLRSYDEVLVSRKSILASKGSLSQSDILSKPIVSSDGDIRHVAERLFGEQAICMVTGDSSFRFRVVANDEAITFVPAFHALLSSENDFTVAVPMKDPYYLEVGFAAKKEVMSSPYIMHLFAKLNACYSKYENSSCISLIPSDLTSCRSFNEDDPSLQIQSLAGFGAVYGVSPRESEVLSDLLKGLTAHSIAENMSVSTQTAKSHIYNIYKKIGVHSQKELINLARRNNVDIGVSESAIRF